MGKIGKAQDAVNHGHTQRAKGQLTSISEAWHDNKICNYNKGIQTIHILHLPPKKRLAHIIISEQGLPCISISVAPLY